MSFKIFKSEGKDIVINTDRIISVRFDGENGKTVIACTDQYIANVDENEEEVKKKLAIKHPGESKVGFAR
jgi:hypothetical protein